MKRWPAIVALLWCGCARQAPLPDLPAIAAEKFAPAVREEVSNALQAARAKPQDAAASGKLGMVLHAHEQYAAAEACYRRAHALSPKEFRWLYYLALVETQQAKNDTAQATLRRALAIDPGYRPAQLRLAELSIDTGKLEEAQAMYEKILRQDGDAAAAHYGLGRIRAAKGDPAGAVEALLKACELFPPYGAAHFALAQAYRKVGEAAKAQEHLDLYEKNKLAAPPSADTLLAEVRALNATTTEYLRRAVELEAAGKMEAALELHLQALAVNPNNEQAHVNLISLYGRMGQAAEAEKHFRTVIAMNLNLADAHYNYGVLLFGQKKYREAKAAFARAVEINPHYAEAQHNLGFMLEQEGKLDQAAALYDKAIANQPDHRLAHFHLGRILVNRRQYAAAIEHFQKTVAVEDQNTPGYMYALGAAYGRSGQRQQATEWLQKALGLAERFGQPQVAASIRRDLGILEQAGGRR